MLKFGDLKSLYEEENKILKLKKELDYTKKSMDRVKVQNYNYKTDQKFLSLEKRHEEILMELNKYGFFNR